MVRRETGKASVVEVQCFAAHRHELHARSRHRLADCFCIGRVVLAALEVGLDVARRHQPDLVAERDQFARPEVRSRARLDALQARSETG